MKTDKVVEFIPNFNELNSTFPNLLLTIENRMTDRSIVTEESILDNETLLESQHRFDALTKIQIWAYGVGHFINDMVAACWFNFLFYYLKRIVKTEAATAALLAGQICDGLATPIVGYISDKYNTRWGKLFSMNHRPKNPLVCFWTRFGLLLLHPHLPRFSKWR